MADEHNQDGVYLTFAVWLAEQDILYRGRARSGLHTLAEALRKHPLSRLDPPERPYINLARTYARAGKPDEARHALAEWEQGVPAGVRRWHFLADAAAGDIASAEGRWRDAIAAYRKWNDESGCPPCGLNDLGVAYDRSGQADSAMSVLQRLTTVDGLGRLENADYALAPAFKRLGELYEQRGDSVKAREYYDKFIAQWKDADSELQPQVGDVRARVARLTRKTRLTAKERGGRKPRK